MLEYCNNQKCLHCSKHIQKFTASNDWKGRKFHKSCWLNHKKIRELYVQRKSKLEELMEDNDIFEL